MNNNEKYLVNTLESKIQITSLTYGTQIHKNNNIYSNYMKQK